MGFITDSLSANEQVVEIFKLHWTSKIPMFFWMVAPAILLASMFIFIETANPEWLPPVPDVYWITAVLVVIGLSLIFCVWEVLKLRSFEQGITNKRVIYKTGIIGRNSEEMTVSSIETVEITQSIMGRLLGFGAVRVTGISVVIFKKVDNPLAVKLSIENLRTR